MDILLYAGIRRYANTSNSYVGYVNAPAGSGPYDLSTTGSCTGIAFTPAAGPEVALLCQMDYLDSQSMVRRKVPGISGFKVCDTSGYYRCGASCSWTVPAGVTVAQFQIWGAGGGTSGQCCCGGSPFGPSGAYATVTIPVTAGSIYTLTAGCAYCCYANQSTAGYGAGGTSSVTGTGLSNFCAMSGDSAQSSWNYGSASCWTGNNPTTTTGPTSCSGWNFCWDGSNDEVCIEYNWSCSACFYGSATCGTVYGFKGLNPRFVMNNASLHTGWTQAPPVFGYLTTTRCCRSYAAGTQWGGCYYSPVVGSLPWMLNPGSGGGATMVCAGGAGSTYTGDSGRMGMVCVTYC